MKWRIILALTMGQLICPGLHAQQNKSQNQWIFHSYNLLGLLEGEAGSAFQLQTVNGVQHGSWFTGLGVGIDNYQFRSVPLFLDIRKFFGKEPAPFFVYGDAGIQYPWVKSSQKMLYQSSFSNGFYADAGIGHLHKFGPGLALSFSIGYTYKDATETSPSYACPFAGPCYDNATSLSYELNRITLKIGIVF
ncbi:MAG: hypothetical protein ACHQEM_10805 [Chitinophagales bacterium]